MNDYDISSIFKDMEDYLLSSMSRNMQKHTNWEDKDGFTWDMWQAKQLESLNDYRKQNNKYVKKQSNFIKLKIEELLKQSNEHGGMEAETKILDAIKKGYKTKRKLRGVGNSFFKVNERKLSALITSVNSDMTKATTAMLRMTNDEYRKTIFKAQVFANSGTATIDQAIDMATKDFLSRGINCIEYSNGARVNIASYAEMAIKTANKRAYLQGEGTKRKEWGIVTVLVSRYGACSETCLPHQGKVYIDDVWSGGTVEDSERLGFPLLSKAIAAGLFHPNCKHTMTTYFEGITTIPSKVDVEKTRENSDVIATQRYNERNIRKYKRLENSSLDAQNKAQYGAKVKEWQGKQRKLTSDHPEMHRSYKRESLRGVNRINTTADEIRDILENNDLNIPKFANNKKELKPIIHNTDKEVNGYIGLMNFNTDNKNVLSVIRNDMKFMPKRDLDLLKTFKLEIGEQTEGASHYRKSKIMFLPPKSSINLKENATQGTFAHEFAHFASDKLNLYEDDEFLDVLENSIKGSKLIELEFNGVRNVALKSKKFISKYQGRTYLTPSDFSETNVIRSKDLKEYISVGYQTYIHNPSLLYSKDKELYNFIDKRGFKYEK